MSTKDKEYKGTFAVQMTIDCCSQKFAHVLNLQKQNIISVHCDIVDVYVMTMSNEMKKNQIKRSFIHYLIVPLVGGKRRKE